MKKYILILFIIIIQNVANAQTTYLAADFSEQEIDTLLGICQKGGLEGLLQTKPFSTFGHYQWSPSFAKNGDESVALMVQKAEKAGVNLGIMVQENAISLNDAYFSQKYFGQFQKDGDVQLHQDISANDISFLIDENDFMRKPSTLNLLLVENEMIVYDTYEYVNGYILLHDCTRGAYGTRSASHRKNAEAHKLWDSPFHFVAPDGALKDSVQMNLKKRMNATGLRFLLQVGATRQEVLEEAVRVRHVERWSKETDPNVGLGWIYIHAADKNRLCTSMDEIEWMMSKAVGFGMGYGLAVDRKAVKEHGGLDELLAVMSQWNQLLYAGALSESQRALLLDPYQDWHIEQKEDSLFQLYAINNSRNYRCSFVEMDSGVFVSDTMEWRADQEGPYALKIKVDGKKEIKNPMVNTSKGLIFFDCTIQPGQCLVYGFDETAYVVDANYNKISEIVPEGLSMLPEGASMVNLMCEMASDGLSPVVSVRYTTREPVFSVTVHHQ